MANAGNLHKAFWSCTGCDRNYRVQRAGLSHLVKEHDGEAHLVEFTPEYQQRLIDGHDELKAKLQAAIAEADILGDICDKGLTS